MTMNENIKSLIQDLIKVYRLDRSKVTIDKDTVRFSLPCQSHGYF